MSAAPSLQPIKFTLHFQRGPMSGQTQYFEKNLVQIGRGVENDVVLANDLRASRHHAEIRWDGVELQVVNISPKNFIAVNGSQVEAATLDNGSVVLIGETEFRIEFDIMIAPPPDIAEPKTKVITEPGDPAVIVQMPILQPVRPAPLQQSPNPVMTSIPAAVSTPAAPPVFQPQAGPLYAVPDSTPQMAMPRPTPSGAGTGPRKLKGDNSKMRFYAIVAVIGVVFIWLMTSNSTKKKELTFRSSEQIAKDLEASREELKTFEERKEKLDNLQYRRAQENYIRGFRDYKQGNYGRARESFQVVLNLDPDNELAKRYYQLARLKFDEMVKFHMLQGNRYREKKNWRMCKSSYFNVMTMIHNNQDPVFKEAKQYYDQCSLAQEGRY